MTRHTHERIEHEHSGELRHVHERADFVETDIDAEVELMRAALHEQGIGCKPNAIHCRASHRGHANRLVSSLHAIAASGTNR